MGTPSVACSEAQKGTATDGSTLWTAASNKAPKAAKLDSSVACVRERPVAWSAADGFLTSPSKPSAARRSKPNAWPTKRWPKVSQSV